jgi:hypothetical protein
VDRIRKDAKEMATKGGDKVDVLFGGRRIEEYCMYCSVLRGGGKLFFGVGQSPMFY